MSLKSEWFTTEVSNLLPVALEVFSGSTKVLDFMMREQSEILVTLLAHIVHTHVHHVCKQTDTHGKDKPPVNGLQIH